ncbi:MAG: hypothetical protein LBT82_04105 [Oscillospiraceae bacterium]|jgi:hypothetical protein|nr:hypothetical protein [Oscillospiraceae bacterium]
MKKRKIFFKKSICSMLYASLILSQFNPITTKAMFVEEGEQNQTHTTTNTAEQSFNVNNFTLEFLKKPENISMSEAKKNFLLYLSQPSLTLNLSQNKIFTEISETSGSTVNKQFETFTDMLLKHICELEEISVKLKELVSNLQLFQQAFIESSIENFNNATNDIINYDHARPFLQSVIKMNFICNSLEKFLKEKIYVEFTKQLKDKNSIYQAKNFLNTNLFNKNIKTRTRIFTSKPNFSDDIPYKTLFDTLSLKDKNGLIKLEFDHESSDESGYYNNNNNIYS